VATANAAPHFDVRKKMNTALYINGVYEDVLEEILKSQNRNPEINYLQPYKGQVIQMLKKADPTLENPVRLYVSTTKNLKNICYVADIVKWEDKREINEKRRNDVNEHLSEFQTGEQKLFTGEGEVGATAINLLSLRNLRRCESLQHVSILIKKSDGIALKERTRAGGWSEVYDEGDLFELSSISQKKLDEGLTESITKSRSSTDFERENRLKNAPENPEKLQVISTGFKRNADIIVEVLIRANGVCEMCKKPAPFIRKSDGTPYLEVHHWIPLSEGGKDTVENAGALCPNCHREVHFG